MQQVQPVEVAETNTSLQHQFSDFISAKTLTLKRDTRLFTLPNLTSNVVGNIQAGMLVYPVGEAQENMIKVEDEQGRSVWVSTALLQLHSSN